MGWSKDPAELDPEAASAELDRLLDVDVDEQLAILERVLHVVDPDLRVRALGLGAAVLSDRTLIEFLRDDADDVRRNAGLEMLKLRRRRAVQLATTLLDDDDPDVVLQAVLTLGHLRDLRALAPLRQALRHPDANVRQEAIVALGRVGHPAALEDLVPLIDAEPWLAVAAIEAVGRLGAVGAIPHLLPYLEAPALGAFVREALSRIGGARAFDALASAWLARPRDDAETRLSQLANVAERASVRAERVPGLDEALGAATAEGGTLGALAARCQRLLRDPASRGIGY